MTVAAGTSFDGRVLAHLEQQAEAAAQLQPVTAAPNDRPLAAWLDVHEQQIRMAGYAKQNGEEPNGHPAPHPPTVG